MTKTILSGVQPTGSLHLGNYLGAIKRFSTLQHDGLSLFCIVDLHAITVKQDPAILRENTRKVAAAYLACGVDPEESIIFPQSAVPYHTELAWVLNCVARVGWLDRMTQFREKTGGRGQNSENASVGLYTYPVLQAADILLYRATHVPVGDDQKQHLNLASDIAKKFNHDFPPEYAPPHPILDRIRELSGDEPEPYDLFPLPQALIPDGSSRRVMSLYDGVSKMSKSDPDDRNRINLDDDNDTIAKKIKRATATTEPVPESLDVLAERPTVKNLVGIYAALTECNEADVLAQFGGKGFGVFKPALAEVAVSKIGPIRDEMARLLDDRNHLYHALHGGVQRANEIARHTMLKVRRRVGLYGA